MCLQMIIAFQLNLIVSKALPIQMVMVPQVQGPKCLHQWSRNHFSKSMLINSNQLSRKRKMDQLKRPLK